MKQKRLILLCAVVLVVSALLMSCIVPPIRPPDAQAPAGESMSAPPDPDKTLVSIPVDAAPSLDGVGDDAMWADAPTLTIAVEKGKNTEATEVTLKSVYSGEMIYFLATWADPTESFVRSPWVKQSDGSWAKLNDPEDRGGDNNLYYEDKVAIIWDIGESIPRFKGMGCFTACHDGENEDVKPYGNKYTQEGMGDIWHWKSIRNVNQVDDQYLDSTQYSADTPEAGRHSDPKDSGGYVNNESEDKKLPMWMGGEGFPRDGSPGYILDAEKQPFDDTLFAAGDMIPGVIVSEIIGDRGNIAAGWQWADGMWTLEFSRALVTGSEYDVQFDDLAKPYYFGIATFDNAQVRHAYHRGSRALVFQP